MSNLNVTFLRCAARALRHLTRHSYSGPRPAVFTASMLVAATLLIAPACESPDTISTEKARTLTPDERYLVQLYLKINNLEKNLQDNPVDSARKWDELKASVDTARVRRVLAELEDDPKRWLGVYSRVNILMTGKDR